MSKSYLINNRGMTMVEIMMALAVFGIFLLTCSSVYKFVVQYNANTLDQLRITELARSEIERAKAHFQNENTITPKEEIRHYPSNLLPEQSYSVKYKSTTLEPGDILELTIGSSPWKFDFAAWLPDPEIPVIASDSLPSGIYDVDEEGNLTSWVTTDNSTPQRWGVSTDPAMFNKIAGLGDEKEVYCKTEPIESFDYLLKLKAPSVHAEGDNDELKNNDFGGISIFDASNVDINYTFGLKKTSRDGYHILFENENKILGNFEFSFNKEYYLEAIGDAEAGTLTLKYGENIVNGAIEDTIEFTVQNFYESTSGSFYLGIKDITSQSVIYYSPLSYYSETENCDL